MSREENTVRGMFRLKENWFYDPVQQLCLHANELEERQFMALSFLILINSTCFKCQIGYSHMEVRFMSILLDLKTNEISQNDHLARVKQLQASRDGEGALFGVH